MTALHTSAPSAVKAVIPDTWLVQLDGEAKDTAVHRYSRVRHLPGGDSEVVTWWACMRHDDRGRGAADCLHIASVKEQLS